MLALLRDLTSRERRTMLACWGGLTLDGFDQRLYSYVGRRLSRYGACRRAPPALGRS
jgi:hypothetical protein